MLLYIQLIETNKNKQLKPKRKIMTLAASDIFLPTEQQLASGTRKAPAQTRAFLFVLLTFLFSVLSGRRPGVEPPN